MKIFTKLLSLVLSPTTQPDPNTLILEWHKNPRLNMLSVQCAQAALQLVQKSARSRFLRAAVAQATKSGTTAEQYLRDQLVAIQGEIEAFDASEKADFERHRGESAKMHPLQMALMKLKNGLTTRRARLSDQILGVNMAQESSIKAASHAGLTMQEMEHLGRFEPPEVSIAKWRTQISEIDSMIAQIASYSADPLKNLKHLVGLPIHGFEQQILGSNA
jgi:hypothetical protein